MDSNEDDRIIKQFQYQCWSEHDVPNASALLEYRRRVHAFHRTRTGPILVHCGYAVMFPINRDPVVAAINACPINV